jgi:hypothetical protein
MSNATPKDPQASSSPSTGTLMVVGLVALGAALSVIYYLAP